MAEKADWRSRQEQEENSSIYIFYQASKGTWCAHARVTSKRLDVATAAKLDFLDREERILLVTFAGRRDDHPDRMLVLPHE